MAAIDNENSGNPTVFISYSWDDEPHKQWVLALANSLRDHAIDAILDQTHLHLGGRTPQFMERSVIDSLYVLVICTPKYKHKFDTREGGAGYEGHIITGELISKVGVTRFIPVLRDGDWATALPAALVGVLGVDLRTDSTQEYQKLVRRLHGITEIRPLGEKPDWLGASANTSIVMRSQAYTDQLRKLPDTDIMKAIWSKPRWRIWSRAEEFKKARFRDLDECARFAASANVRYSSRWTDYPRFPAVLERHDECIANEVAITEGNVHHWERWLLFRSAQFVHNMALDRVMQLSDRHTHPLEILDIVTAAYEFVGRMADRKIVSGNLALSFEFQNVAGQQLTWPTDITLDIDGVSPNAWCEEEAFSSKRIVPADELAKDRRALAMETTLEIFSRFRWTNPPKESLQIKQQERLGPPQRC